MIVEESVYIDADVRKVWETLTDLTCWAGWNTVLRDVGERTPRIAERTSISCTLRPFIVPLSLKLEIEEVMPYKRIVWRGRKYGLAARHEYLFSPKGRGVTVISREDFSGLPVLFGGLFFPKARIRQLTRTLLADLKKAAEASVQP